jgi:hypothetical protein
MGFGKAPAEEGRGEGAVPGGGGGAMEVGTGLQKRVGRVGGKIQPETAAS